MTDQNLRKQLKSRWMAYDSYFEDLAVFGLGPLHPGGIHATQELLTARNWGGVKVLDVGCGNGTTARLIEQLGGSVICVEPSPLMREAAVQQGINSSNILPYTVQELRLGTEYFDVILIEGVVGFVPNPATHLEQLLNHLVPRGDLFVCDWIQHERPCLPEYSFHIYGAFNPELMVERLRAKGFICRLSFSPVVARAFALKLDEACRRASLFFGEPDGELLRGVVERKLHLMRTALKSSIETTRFILRATAP